MTTIVCGGGSGLEGIARYLGTWRASNMAAAAGRGKRFTGAAL